MKVADLLDDSPSVGLGASLLGGMLAGYVARQTRSVTYRDVRAWLDKHGGRFRDESRGRAPLFGHECPDCESASYFAHEGGDLRSDDGLTYFAHPYDLYECAACGATVTAMDLSPSLLESLRKDPGAPRDWWKR